MKSLTTTLLILFGVVSLSTQNPIIANYTRQLLRQAKTAEFLSYKSNEDYACSNFYEQSCGNWKKTFPATYDELKTSHLGQIQNLYVNKAQLLLETYQGFDVSHEFVSKFYASCANKTQIQQIGIAPVLQHLKFDHNWPLIEEFSWYDTEYDWLKFVADVRRDLGLNLFIGLELKSETSLYANTKRIQIDAPKLPLGTSSKYLDAAYEDEREHYKQKIAEKLQVQFPKMSAEWCQEVADQVLNVEISLAEGIPAYSGKQPAVGQSIGELKSKYATYVDFSRYLTLIFNRTINEQIYELSPGYFNNLLKVIELTPKLTIANYTMWRVLDHLGFAADKNGEDYEIWCTKQAIRHFPAHVASLYSIEFKAKAADKTGTLINKIFSEIKKSLEIKFGKIENFAWMSQQTRQKANENFGRLTFPVPDSLELNKELVDILQKIKNNQYYENLLEILQFETKKELQINTHDNSYQSAAVHTTRKTPYYSSKHNEIIVPIQFIQEHFLFDAEYPNAINYGTLGVLLAQQLLRGLLHEDATKKWWDNATQVAFQARKDCFAKQLKNYKFQGKPVDDKDGILKFIIDTSAVEIALDAYTAWLGQEGIDRAEETLSDKLSYANERLFFVSFGQMYCADYYLFAFRSLKELPERLLVNGALANFAKFGEIFSCTSDRKMNPKHKCTIF